MNKSNNWLKKQLIVIITMTTMTIFIARFMLIPLSLLSSSLIPFVPTKDYFLSTFILFLNQIIFCNLNNYKLWISRLYNAKILKRYQWKFLIKFIATSFIFSFSDKFLHNIFSKCCRLELMAIFSNGFNVPWFLYVFFFV